MATEGPFDNNSFSYQFSLSAELLYVLQWIAENEYETLKEMALHALVEAESHTLHQSNSKQEAHENIIDFFATLEAAISSVLDEETVKNNRTRSLLPALDKIDTHACDDNTVAFSAAQAASKHAKNPETNPQDLLFKELLKRWKPAKKPHAH